FSNRFGIDECLLVRNESGFHFLGRVESEHTGQGWVGDDEPAVRSSLKNALRGILKYAAVTGFSFPQGIRYFDALKSFAAMFTQTLEQCQVILRISFRRVALNG